MVQPARRLLKTLSAVWRGPAWYSRAHHGRPLWLVGKRSIISSRAIRLTSFGAIATGLSSLGLGASEAGVHDQHVKQTQGIHNLQSFSSTLPLEHAPIVHHNTSETNLQGAIQELTALLGHQRISIAKEQLTAHSGSDYQSYNWTADTAVTSHLLVYPTSTEDVAGIAKICHRRHIPITPYSGGTSIEGHYSPTRQGVCMDFTMMDKILEVNPLDLDCTVQPGIGWCDLNEELADKRLFFPPDPGPGAMIGGMVSTGCSGTNAAAYGTMKDWVLSLTVVLADGTVIKTRQRPRKSSAGYDLTRLFVGSEGTLGLVTEATLKLAVKPRVENVAVVTFPTVRSAASAVQSILSQGIQVGAVEILDEVQMRSINEAGSTRRRWDELPSLFFKFTGPTETSVRETSDLVRSLSHQHGSTSFLFAASEDEKEELWSARKAALWSMMALRKSPTDKVCTTDVAVPLSRLAEIIELTKVDIDNSGLLGSIVGHVGDGNFHTLLMFDESQRAVADKLVHTMVERAIEMKGTATGEHGVGLVKRDYLEMELGRTTVDTMRRLKTALDPLCLLNCDKVIRMEAEC